MPALTPDEVEQIFRTEESGFVFRFAESESYDITGPGHQDKEEFLGALKMYDGLSSAEEGFFVDHIYAIVLKDHNGDLHIRRRSKDSINAIPLTIVWGQR